ncbi:MAG: hypothetical protein AB1491_06490 [Thermodesulfobacteriota bacterium]
MPPEITEAMINAEIQKLGDNSYKVREEATDKLIEFLNQDPQKVLPMIVDLFLKPPADPEVEERLGRVIAQKIDELAAGNDLDKLRVINGYLVFKGIADRFSAEQIIADRDIITVSVLSPPMGARFTKLCAPDQETNFCRFEIPVSFTVTFNADLANFISVSWEYQDKNGWHRSLITDIAHELRHPNDVTIIKTLLCGETETIELKIIAVASEKETGRNVIHTVSKKLTFICGPLAPEEKEEKKEGKKAEKKKAPKRG